MSKLEEFVLSIRWKTVYIHGQETMYEVSDIGQVRNLKTRKILKPAKNKDGYLGVSLSINNKPKYHAIHRLVAEAFVNNPDPITKVQVNHIDGNKLNNHYQNLEWVTQQENIDHAVKTGLRDSFLGVNSPKNIYSEETIHQVCRMLEQGETQKRISERLGINKGIINSIKQKKIWRHISDKYNIPETIHRTPRPAGTREKVIIMINNGFDNYRILKELNLPNNRLNRTYVAVIRSEIKNVERSSTSPL